MNGILEVDQSRLFVTNQDDDDNTGIDETFHDKNNIDAELNKNIDVNK